ncbi:flagellar biosynthesis sigma factor [Caballeronia sp. M23-90]
MTNARTNKWLRWVASVVLGLAVVGALCVKAKPADEVILTIGESYTQIRQQSHSTLPVLTSENRINLYVRRPAVLRFSDPQYGFVTPAAKFLSLYADKNGNVAQLTLSPQVETLPLDEAVSVAVNLQDQLRRAHWRSILTVDHPPIMNTPAMRAAIHSGANPQTFWLAGDRYQVSLDIRRFNSESWGNGERYLITLQLSGPPLMTDRLSD